MSVDATRWAWQQKLPASRKLVLLSLADRASEDHTAWPSVQRLADDTGLDRKTVMEAISELERDGLIEPAKVPGKVTVYKLLGVVDRHATSTENGTSTKNGTGTKNGTAPVPKTVLLPVPKTGHEPKRRTNQEPTNKGVRAVMTITDLMAQGVDRQHAEDWMAIRKAKRLPLTRSAWAQVVREAARAGLPIQKAVELAASSGWAGFRAQWCGANASARPSDTYDWAQYEAHRAAATKPPAEVLKLARRK